MRGMFISIGCDTFYVEDEGDCLIFAAALAAVQHGILDDECLEAWRVGQRAAAVGAWRC